MAVRPSLFAALASGRVMRAMRPALSRCRSMRSPALLPTAAMPASETRQLCPSAKRMAWMRPCPSRL